MDAQLWRYIGHPVIVFPTLLKYICIMYYSQNSQYSKFSGWWRSSSLSCKKQTKTCKSTYNYQMSNKQQMAAWQESWCLQEAARIKKTKILTLGHIYGGYDSACLHQGTNICLWSFVKYHPASRIIDFDSHIHFFSRTI